MFAGGSGGGVNGFEHGWSRARRGGVACVELLRGGAAFSLRVQGRGERGRVALRVRRCCAVVLDEGGGRWSYAVWRAHLREADGPD